MAKHYIIYETKNLIDGKIYIGMHETDNLKDGYLGSGTRLKRAIRYYGKEFFERKILFTFGNREDMIAKEVELVTEEFVQRKDTYNLKPGGDGGLFNKNHLKKLSSAGNSKLKWLYENDPNWVSNKNKKIRNSIKKGYQNGRKPVVCDWSGRKHSEETKSQMSASHINKHNGKLNSQYGTTWIHNIDLKKSIKVKTKEVKSYINNGWIKGRKINF